MKIEKWSLINLLIVGISAFFIGRDLVISDWVWVIWIVSLFVNSFAFYSRNIEEITIVPE